MEVARTSGELLEIAEFICNRFAIMSCLQLRHR